MSVLTLLTDFGTDDEYVGLMKGVILSINPSATIVDITHGINRQDIAQAAYTISAAYPYFPSGTVHLVVVDPGVGSRRRLLALKLRKHFFIAPDNGVLSLLFSDKNVLSLSEISNPKYFRASVSPTFHGRDIIAPVGAHITNGLDVSELGPEIDVSDALCLEKLEARCTEKGELQGEVVAVDHFGNLITNIKSEQLSECLPAVSRTKVRIRLGSRIIGGLADTYASMPAQTPSALIGSRGYLEIAVNKDSAARCLNAKAGDEVWVVS